MIIPTTEEVSGFVADIGVPRKQSIHYLPEIRPGELFNSVFMRMLWHRCESISLNTFFKHWHNPGLFYHTAFVPPLPRFYGQCPAEWERKLSPEYLIGACCILPFLSPYLLPTERKRQVGWTLGEVDSHLAPVFNGKSFSLPPTHFKACPECLSADIKQWCEPYLRRSHHLPGIDFCVQHKCKLHCVGTARTPVPDLRSELRRLSRCQSESVDFIPDSLLLHLRESVDGLFSRPIVFDENLNFVRLYRHQLDLRGINKKTWSESLIGSIYSKYGVQTAKSLEFDNWMHLVRSYLAGNQAYLPPIAHLVLQEFLGISFRDAMEYSDGKLWRCANPFTECGRVVVERTSARRTTEYLRCPECGFEARVRRNSPLGAKPEIEEIIRRGPMFEAYISSAVAHGASIESLRRKSGMSYRTLAVILRELGHKPKRGGGLACKNESPGEARAKKRDRHRKAFLAHLKTNPGATRKSIAMNLSTVYDWLLTNDKEWYVAHAPAVVGSSKTPAWLQGR